MKNYESTEPCVVCGLNLDNAVCYHHIKSRKASGSDHKCNLIPVCAKHHNEFHQLGNTRMSVKYASVANWLTKNGWEFVGGKWFHEDAVK